MAPIKKIILKIYFGNKFVTKYELAKLLHINFPNMMFGPTYLCEKNSYYSLAYTYINLCLFDAKPFSVKDENDKIIYKYQILFNYDKELNQIV